MEKQHKKILFVQKTDGEDYETEGLWCISTIDDNYVVDNIPFVAKRVALGDVIAAEYDEEENAFYFDEFVSVSGNSTLRIYVRERSSIPSIREVLLGFNCDSEVFLDRNIVAVNVPKDVVYLPIKRFLDEGERAMKWQYEEACLAHQYK